MIAIDTDEKLNWFLNGLENEEFIIGGTNPTEEDLKEFDREIAKYKAMQQKSNVIKEPVFA